MEILLNRWRGTDGIGGIIYALYLGFIVGLLTEYYYAISMFCLFLIGKSMGWGKWVGYLTSNKPIENYEDLEGTKFPFIHQIANFIAKEKRDYKLYCQVALTIRGFIWWTPILILLGYIDLLDCYQVVINSLILALGFPVACELSKYWDFEYKSKHLSISGNWEKQEVIYGLFQFLCISFSIFLNLI